MAIVYIDIKHFFLYICIEIKPYYKQFKTYRHDKDYRNSA